MRSQWQFGVLEVHTSPWEAHVTRALLESEGVPALLSNEHHVGANWPASLLLGGVKLLVRHEDLESARRVLAMRDSGELQAALEAQWGPVDPLCPSCGSSQVAERSNRLSIGFSATLLVACNVIYPPAKVKVCKRCGASVDGEA